MKKFIQRFTALALAAAMLMTEAFAQPSEEEFSVPPDEITADVPTAVGSSIMLHEGMRALMLYAGTDF